VPLANQAVGIRPNALRASGYTTPQTPPNQALTDAARVMSTDEGINELLQAVRPHNSIECVDSIMFA